MPLVSKNVLSRVPSFMLPMEIDNTSYINITLSYKANLAS